MIEDFYFLDETPVSITAASVGISKKRWTHVKENEIVSKEYLKLMKTNRFDHLPIINNNESVYEYFKTYNPNDFSKIDKFVINHDDVIPLDTNIKDVIDKFAASGRTFYFLSFHKNISGLITLGNLNCKQVQVYIFSLICELERQLGDFLNSQLTSIQIENWIKSKTELDSPNEKFKKILDYYNQLQNSDLENQLTEHLFLVDFFNIISTFNLNQKLSYSNAKFEKFSSINELRNRIAHPTRSLLDSDNNIFKLKERLDKVHDLSFRLSKFKNS